MVDTKLILIEGLPGAGKTTTAVQLGKYLQQLGRPCRWHLEEDDPHPIDCLKFKLKDLPEKLPPLWIALTEQMLHEPTVAIIESRLWQNTALFMFMSEYAMEAILKVHQLVWQELAPLSPVLFYLQQDQVEIALRRLYDFRDQKWMDWALETTTKYPWFQARGLTDFAGWVQFFQAWQPVAEALFNDWPYAKTKISNPHDDWASAFDQIHQFLHIKNNPSADSVVGSR